MAVMERPAPVRLVTDGEGANMPADHTRPRAALSKQPNRIYIQALIDHRDLPVPAVEAYADRLANTWHWENDEVRAILREAIVAYMDGYDAGFEAGYNMGHDEGENVGRGLYGRPPD